MLRQFYDASATPALVVDETIEEFWEECVFLQCVHSEGAPWKRRRAVSDGEAQNVDSIGFRVSRVGISLSNASPYCAQAFSEAAMKNAMIRTYVRRHRTPVPSEETSETEAEKAARYLVFSMDRVWRMNSDAMLHCIGQTDNQESVLRELVSLCPHLNTKRRLSVALGIQADDRGSWNAESGHLPQYSAAAL